MVSIEKEIKSQFEKVFTFSDWSLFKKIAESNLSDAAHLLQKNMPIERPFKLLARNSRKRLLIGVGIELLLRAVYLKHGYMINKPPKGSPLRFPFSSRDANDLMLDPDKTYKLNDLIQNLHRVVHLQNKDTVIRGLKIAKVFRNKEGHGVTKIHKYEPTNYTDIASALIALYRDAFGERLVVRFSIARNEKAIWQISSLN